MIRLYATQMLLVAGAITVIVVERHIARGAGGFARDDGRDASAKPWSSAAGRRAGGGPPPAQAAAALARIPEARLRSALNRY